MHLLNQLVEQSRRSLSKSEHFCDMKEVVTIILGGGQGTRLAPLTLKRCKPAVQFGGKYRLIDIPISNALNSGCHRIFILTQFLSTTLHQHIGRTYHPSNFSGFIEFLAAEQGPDKTGWYQGTADAVRQNIEYLVETAADYFLILSGDQLYHMNFQHMLRFAKETNADLVVASLPVDEENAKRMGVLKINEDRFITEFYEKPQTSEALEHMRISEITSRQLGQMDNKLQHLGSMGIYLFKRKALFDLLRKDQREDFGKHLIPTKVQQGKVAAYIFNDYWEDIGTISSFYNANIALTEQAPAFSCYNDMSPIFSAPIYLPAPRIGNSHIKNSIICEGCLVDADKVESSILGPRTVVKSGSRITKSYLMGNDFYLTPSSSEHLPKEVHIGHDCIIDQAIIDKHVHIGNNVHLVNHNKLQEYNSDFLTVKDGIIVISSGAVIPDGFKF